MIRVPLSAWSDYRRRHRLRVVRSEWREDGELIVYVEVVGDDTQTWRDEVVETAAAETSVGMVEPVGNSRSLVSGSALCP